jgi:sporulation protein YlmC with PRC-barrel domain
MKKSMMAFTAAWTLLAGAASATDKVDIRTWTLDQEGRDGWSVKKLIGTTAFGPNRKEIGHVENVIFNPEGKVLKLIVTTGGFLGFDETPLAVNWKDVKIGPDIDYVNTPITVESLDKYTGCSTVCLTRSRMASDRTHRRLREPTGRYPLRRGP